MTTEKQLQEGIRASIISISEYFDGDTVRINDDVFLDQSIQKMPAVNIINSDEFAIRQDERTETGIYTVITLLYVEFVDWKESQDLFRDVRQAIIDKFNEVGTARSAGGLAGVTINALNSGGPVTGISYDDSEQTFPVYLMQPILFDVELF